MAKKSSLIQEMGSRCTHSRDTNAHCFTAMKMTKKYYYKTVIWKGSLD